MSGIDGTWTTAENPDFPHEGHYLRGTGCARRLHRAGLRHISKPGQRCLWPGFVSELRLCHLTWRPRGASSTPVHPSLLHNASEPRRVPRYNISGTTTNHPGTETAARDESL